jgi:inner membrane transporter RhtA
VLSSVIPYALELGALRRLSARTFSIVLSLEPALAAVVGAAALEQTPKSIEVVAIACVVSGSIGSSRTAGEALPPPD